MFVGHYAVSFALKKSVNNASLGMLFLAVQFVDILWAIFVLFGIEKVRITPGFTESNALDLYYMPYTHSVPAFVLWSLAIVGIFYYLHSAERAKAKKISIAMGFAVFSHFLIDLLVHKPDMGLIGDSFKIGLGLWDHKWFAFALETVFLFVGGLIYLSILDGSGFSGKYGAVIFILFLQFANYINFFLNPPPESPQMAAISSLVMYFALAGIAFWLDRKRIILKS